MLTSEFEAEHAPVSKQIPCSPLGKSRVLSQLPRPLELDSRDGRAPPFHETHHSPSLPLRPIGFTPARTHSRSQHLPAVPPLHNVERGSGGEGRRGWPGAARG